MSAIDDLDRAKQNTCGGEPLRAFVLEAGMKVPLLADDRDAERKAWARLLNATVALRDAVASDLADRERGCRPADLSPERGEVSIAKQALCDLGVDVDALLGEP